MSTQGFRPLRYSNRWFCYLDLLGFTALVNDENIARVIPLYQKALGEMERFAKPKHGHGVTYSWFSDTFIIYSYGGKLENFPYVEQTGRLFFQSLILNRIPVRGALTHGKLYSQSSKNIFVGPALIDAYYYGEKQDWLGFVLTPKAVTQLAGSPVDASKLAHYREVTKPGVIKHEPASPVYAFAFNNMAVNGENPYIAALLAMKLKAPPMVSHKYANSIEFAQEHDRGIIQRARSA
jgi:hypothetical protein